MALRGNSGLRAEKRREYTRASSSLTSEVRQVRVTRFVCFARLRRQYWFVVRVGLRVDVF